jgi:hypothetical protein
MRFAYLIVGLSLVGVASAASPADDKVAGLLRKAATARASEAESRWMSIPWLTSAAEAERLARKEGRPILYWNVDDDPLDRC